MHDNKKETQITTTIYKDDHSDAARSIWLTLNNGILSMEQQDIGPLVERFYGDSDYERFLHNISANAVEEVLGTASDKALISKLKEMFGTNSGFDDFAEFLRKNNIEHKYGSY